MVTGPRTDSYRINFGIQKDSHPARLTVAPGRPTFWCSDTRARAPARRPFIPFVLYTGPSFFLFLHTVRPRPWGSPFSVGFLFFIFFLHVSENNGSVQQKRWTFFPPSQVRSPRSVVAGSPSRNFRPSLIFTPFRDVFSKTDRFNYECKNRKSHSKWSMWKKNWTKFVRN